MHKKQLVHQQIFPSVAWARMPVSKQAKCARNMLSAPLIERLVVIMARDMYSRVGSSQEQFKTQLQNIHRGISVTRSCRQQTWIMRYFITLSQDVCNLACRSVDHTAAAPSSAGFLSIAMLSTLCAECWLTSNPKRSSSCSSLAPLGTGVEGERAGKPCSRQHQAVRRRGSATRCLKVHSSAGVHAQLDVIPYRSWSQNGKSPAPAGKNCKLLEIRS